MTRSGSPADTLDDDKQKRVQAHASGVLPARSYPDILSRQKEGLNGKREPEQGMREYLTIQEAAKRCGVSDKTIQRAIRRGTLPARYPQSNHCEIDASDLDTFLSGHVQTATKQRLAEQVSGRVQAETERHLAELEERVQHLERLIEDILSRPTALKPSSRAKARERTTGPLPKQFVSLLAMAAHHNIAESKVQTHVGMGLLPAKRGEWTDANGTIVTLALDAKGRAAFYQIYR